VAYTVQTTVDALHNIPIDFKIKSTQTVSKALRCYFAVGSCYFKLFLWLYFFPTNSIYNKKNSILKSLIFTLN
jgi:hypothetical protein